MFKEQNAKGKMQNLTEFKSNPKFKIHIIHFFHFEF
jgi:hypothetical protein